MEMRSLSWARAVGLLGICILIAIKSAILDSLPVQPMPAGLSNRTDWILAAFMSLGGFGKTMAIDGLIVVIAIAVYLAVKGYRHHRASS
jgi:hypothetical protein